MAVQARISAQADRDGITELMHRAFGPDLAPRSIDPSFQRWKYWDDTHPFMPSGRSYVLNGKERIVGHACRWPMRVLTAAGTFDAFHLIDWAADSTHAGAGLQVLRDSFDKSAALFSIGGSPTTRRMLPALGEHLRRRAAPGQALTYQAAGHVCFLNRPLKAVATAVRESPIGWRTLGRVVKNAVYSVLPIPRLPIGYSFTQVNATEIREELWPRPTPDMATTARTPELLRHFANCPVLQQPMYFVVTRNSTPVAYFFLVLAGTQVRLADFGPADLDSPTTQAVSMAAQVAAKQHYPEALRMAVVTSELTVRSAFLASGFRQSYQEEIRGLVNSALVDVKQYRLTYLDLDALCL